MIGASTGIIELRGRYGVAQLRGKSAKQRALELITIAHPDFRAELAEQARRMNLL